jgi:hypothetical protein
MNHILTCRSKSKTAEAVLVEGDIYPGNAFLDCLAPVTRAHAENIELMIRR